MPLQHVTGPQYMNRFRVFIDPDKRDLERSVDQFNYLIDLDNLYEKVAGIELVDYNIRGTLQKTFMERDGAIPGNNIVDIHMEDTATGLQVLDFAVTITPAGYTDLATMAADLTTQFNTQMDAQGHAFHNTANGVVWTITENTSINGLGVDQVLDFLVEEGAVADTIEANFLFETGPNSENNASLPLGFDNLDTAVFTVGATTYFNPVSPFRPELFPFRYVDIFIKEFDEHRPVARVFLTNVEYYVRGRRTVQEYRLLTTPVKRLTQMRISMFLPRRRRPPIEVCAGVDLTFDLLLIRPATKVPDWVQQRLKY